jgi:hypothetical protein
MKRTKAATKWLRTAKRYTTTSAYVAILNRAHQIAKERAATQLGKIHCEIALEQLDKEERSKL